MTPAAQAGNLALEADYRDWIALLKPRVLTLVVFTGVIGLMVAPGHLHPVLAFTAILCITVAAGACGAINMWYDRDIDAIMRRTRKRPIPAGRIEPGAALGFGITLAVGSVIVMGLAVNIPAALILALSVCFYVFIYTIWLKRRTPQNIVIGGAAGAFPPVIGWAAVTGTVDLVPLVLFGIVFIWTPPHFWSLALWANDDYRRAGVPMLPVVAGATGNPAADHAVHAGAGAADIGAVSSWASAVCPTPWRRPCSVLVFLLRVYRVLTDRAGRRKAQPDAGCSGQGGVQILDLCICSRCSARWL